MPIATYQGLGTPQRRFTRLSSASTALTLTQDNVSAINLWPAQSSASRILLPVPEVGMEMFIFFEDDAVSTGTRVGTSVGSVDVLTTGGTTGAYGRFTTEEGGHGVLAVAISDVRWALFPYGSVALAAVTS
mgnify:FL=1